MAKTKTKIAVICNYVLHPDRIGGMDRFFVAYDKACKVIGHEVDWFFPDSEAHEFYKGLTVISGQGSVERIFLNHSAESKKKYDIIVTHFVELCTSFFKTIKQLHNAYCIAVDHNPRPLEGFPLKKQLKNRIKGMFHGKYIDIFAGVSQYTCKHLRKDYGSTITTRIKLVYNGIDTTVFKKRTENTPMRFIVSSHLRQSKGIQDLVAAIAQLPENLKSKIHIDIFGKGPYENELKMMVRENILEEQLIFKGSSSCLPEIYCEYAYMIQPTYMECFSLSILESLAANVPVITTTVGGNEEVVEHGKNGYIFEPKDVGALKNILQDMLHGKKEITEDVSNQIETDFNLNQMVANHIKLLPCT